MNANKRYKRERIREAKKLGLQYSKVIFGGYCGPLTCSEWWTLDYRMAIVKNKHTGNKYCVPSVKNEIKKYYFDTLEEAFTFWSMAN